MFFSKMIMLAWSEILIRLFLASFLGALIGMERERKDWSAGTRTHMMVSVGACLFMIVSSFGFSDVLGTPNVDLDPSRVAAQVVSGIGFIGAGAILFLRQGIVRGLTTAAGLWTVAAIGLATGGGMYFAAVAATVISLMILWALQPIQQLYSQRFRQVTLRIVTDSHQKNREIISNLRKNKNLRVASYVIEQKKDNCTYIARLRNISVDKVNEIVSELESNPEIKEFSWTQ